MLISFVVQSLTDKDTFVQTVAKIIHALTSKNDKIVTVKKKPKTIQSIWYIPVYRYLYTEAPAPKVRKIEKGFQNPWR